MKLKILISGFFILLFLGISFTSSASDGVELTVDFLEQYVAIQMQPTVLLPELTNGYSSSSSIWVANVGTTDITVESDLVSIDYYLGDMTESDDDYNPVFLLMELSLNGEYSPFYDFRATIEKPAIAGDVRTEMLSLRLNLENYSDFIKIDDNQVAVVLTVLPDILV